MKKFPKQFFLRIENDGEDDYMDSSPTNRPFPVLAITLRSAATA